MAYDIYIIFINDSEDRHAWSDSDPVTDREALLALYDQGSLSGAAFARRHGLRYPTFMSWLKKRKQVSAKPEGGPLFRMVESSRPSRRDDEATLIFDDVRSLK